jgi:hypothetical protein
MFLDHAYLVDSKPRSAAACFPISVPSRGRRVRVLPEAVPLTLLLALLWLAPSAPCGTAAERGREAAEVTTATVFGIGGRGNTFAFVFDRSGSMSEYEGRPLAAAKAELINALKTLRPTNQFAIIFYNHRIAVFNPFEPQPARLIFGDDSIKGQAERFVNQISAAGGTQHMEPVKLALRLGPDVLFFLTDGREPPLTARQLDDLDRMNRGTVIHAIEFGAGPAPEGDCFLKHLARRSAGHYVYIDVTKLPKR